MWIEQYCYVYVAEKPISVVPAVSVSELVFAYANAKKSSARDAEIEKASPALNVSSLRIYQGERILICGPNGAGKSTLLAILGGRKLVNGSKTLVLGRQCFNDCSLVSKVCYLGDWWRTDFFLDVTMRAFLGDRVTLSDRCKVLCDILRVDLDWKISYLSDGQRRRCQIIAALTVSDQFEVYILDEVTSDLDIPARERLLEWLKCESDRGATILYSTHILDGMNKWATRLLYMESGQILRDIPVEREVPIFEVVREWMLNPA
jgi:CCR4-NOT complex subunit CAF16